MRRRSFLTLAAGLPLSGFARAAMRRAPAASLVIYDPALPASDAFAQAAARRGATLKPLAGDAIRFARSLAKELEHGPRPIAAMTGYADYLLLSGSLGEAGYRIAGEAFHRLRDGQPHHRCAGNWAALESPLARSADQWPVAIAAMAIGDARYSSQPACPSHRDQPQLLVSWALRHRTDPS